MPLSSVVMDPISWVRHTTFAMHTVLSSLAGGPDTRRVTGPVTAKGERERWQLGCKMNWVNVGGPPEVNTVGNPFMVGGTTGAVLQVDLLSKVISDDNGSFTHSQRKEGCCEVRNMAERPQTEEMRGLASLNPSPRVLGLCGTVGHSTCQACSARL